MKKILQYILVFSLVGAFSACTDDEDYRDLNQTPFLDSPAFLMESDKGDTIQGGETITFTINLIESPAGYDSVSVSTSRGEGTTSVSGFEQLVGQTGGGEFTVTATPPASFLGAYEVTITVYDAQRNDKGDLARRQFAETESFFVEYPLELATFDLTFDSTDPIIKGGTADLTISIEAPAGIDTVVVLPSSGTVELDAASLSAALGQTSAEVTGTFTASEEAEDVGDVEFEVRVRDREQQALVIETFTTTTVFEFAVPTFDISGPDRTLARVPVTFDVNIAAEGLIDTVIVEAFIVNTEDPIGVIEMDTASFEAIQGENSGTYSFDFAEDEYLGYIDIVVTVIDMQGAETSESLLFLNERNCEYNIDDFLGDFNALEPGYGTYGVTFSEDPVVENRIISDNFWDFSGVVYYDIVPDTKVITIPSQVVTMGGDDYTVVGSGMIDTCKGSFYVDYTVTDADGVLQDENTHTFTR